MKEGYVTDASGVPNEQELKAINKLSRRSLSADEVFVFSVVLCDNEIDRDFERFTNKTLETIAKLYVGKTGIFDHSMKGRDQVARIFACQVEKPEGQTTSYGEAYVRVKARAYMPRTEKNRELITEIDAGIKKEVSVGCSVSHTVCSICGADQKTDGCRHQKGRVYQQKGKDLLCHHLLEGAADAYEWSFVAVPAQRGAGVVKAFGRSVEGGVEVNHLGLMKQLSCGEEVTLSPEQAKALATHVTQLEQAAVGGREHCERVLKDTLRLGRITQPTLSGDLLYKMLQSLPYGELCEVNKAFAKQMDALLPPVSQLDEAKQEKSANKADFGNFLI